MWGKVLGIFLECLAFRHEDLRGKGFKGINGRSCHTFLKVVEYL